MSILNNKLDILVLGTDGMLGHDVYEFLTKLSCYKKSIINNVIGFDREKLDYYDILDNYSYFDSFIYHNKRFDYIINCVAMTDTYAAENTKEGKELSYKLNALFPLRLAKICKHVKTKLIHISTDYIFSEKSPEYSTLSESVGFFMDDTPAPVNNYGTHKLIGEQFIKETLKEKDYTILRTSWLYGQHNQKSFVHKFLKNAFDCMDNDKNIEVTENEYSVPTSTDVVCEYIYQVILNNLYGVIHAVCASNNGSISRYNFAKSIAEQYNIIVDKCPDIIRRKIDIDKIVPVTRDEKLQPTHSFMRYSPLYDREGGFDWVNALYMFLSKNFNKLPQ